jgi:type-IV secretion system protein TraC
MNRTLADYLELWGIEDQVLVFSDGSLGAGLELTPMDVSCSSDDDINEISAKLTVFLNSLPAGLDVQFVQDIEPGNERVISEHLKLIKDASPSIVSDISQARAQRLRELDAAGQLPKHSLRIFLRKPLSGKLVQTPSLFKRAQKFAQTSASNLEKEINAFERMVSDAVAPLISVGILPTRMPNDEVIRMIYEQWNPERKVPLNSYDPDDVRSSLLFTDVGIYDRGFSLSGVHHRILSLKILPDQTYAAMASALRQLPFGSRLFLTFNVPDQAKELEKLQVQRRIAFSMVNGKGSGVSDIESQAKLKDLEELIEEMVAAGEKVFKVSLNVLLRSNDPEELSEMVSRSLLTIRELGGADAMEESLASFDVFSQVSLPNARCKERQKYLKTSNLADFLPVYGPWIGHSSPKVLLRSRLGSLIKFDPFSSSLTNANQIISGGSGSGKSFLTNLILMQMMKEDPQVFIVDIGGSYKKLSENFDGQYIPLGIDSGLSLNPFDLALDETNPSSQKIKFILGLVELMTKENEASGLGRLERAEIEGAIEEVYRTSKAPSFSVLQNVLSRHADPAIKRISRVLAPWCGTTAFGSFVDKPTNIQLTKPVVCFDLKGLDTVPDLQAVVLYIITDFVLREVQKDRSRMKFLIFDECWKLLEDAAGASFIGEVFRTFRKYFASAIAISQNIDDFAKSKIATAILSNSSIKWILRQKGADKERLKDVLSLNPNEVNLISSLGQERGVYSEAFLMVEDRRTVVSVETTPLEYWLATTDPRDLAMLQARKTENPNLSDHDLLSKLAIEFPKGCASQGGV